MRLGPRADPSGRVYGYTVGEVASLLELKPRGVTKAVQTGRLDLTSLEGICEAWARRILDGRLPYNPDRKGVKVETRTKTHHFKVNTPEEIPEEKQVPLEAVDRKRVKPRPRKPKPYIQWTEKNEYVYATGTKTYYFRERLKKLGFRWSRRRKRWWLPKDRATEYTYKQLDDMVSEIADRYDRKAAVKAAASRAADE